MKLSHEKAINVRNILGLAIVFAGATISFSVEAQSGGATGGVSLSTAGPSASATASAAAPRVESSAPPYLNRYIAEDNLWELGLFGGLMFVSSSHNLREPGSAQQPFKTAGELGARIAYFPLAYVGAEVEGAALPSELEDGSAGGLLAGRLHVIGQLPISSITPFALFGGGALGGASTRMGTDGDPAIHFGVGAKAAFDEYVSVRLDVRDTMTQKFDADAGAQTHHPEVLIGLTFTLERTNPDADGDGFADHRDDCPAVPGENHGCPAPDQDRDGIADEADQCKDVPGVAPTGCPDRDGDGRLDAVDACPDQPAPTKTGCPETPCNCTDTDGDGRMDSADKCPTVPAATADGCPIGDTDGDGLKDDADKCPDKPETPNGFQDSDGCPDEGAGRSPALQRRDPGHRVCLQ
jgi:OOP family OmpA-OmpF porin